MARAINEEILTTSGISQQETLPQSRLQDRTKTQNESNFDQEKFSGGKKQIENVESLHLQNYEFDHYATVVLRQL